MTEPTLRRVDVFDQAFLTGATDACEVLLIRHGQQDIPDRNTIVGDLFDPPLSDQGRLQARLLGEALSTTHMDAIYSSPLRRAHETAQAVARHQRLEIHVVDDLREIEIFRDAPRDRTALEFLGEELLRAVRQRMLNERKWDVYPYSESSFEFRKRTINAIEAIIAANAGERIALFCHGGVINAYAAHIAGSPFDMFFRPAHTSVNVFLAGSSRRVLSSLNDVHHLQTAEGDFRTY